uniref:Metalloendopeptidase n=1 Tax=Meloidogyne hapla TaxID=6305 RepID=A0A1I8BFX6_MELHA
MAASVAHEIMHTLGFHHEMQRSDRNEYVWINYDNQIIKSENNFGHKNSENLETPYDYGSLMHYPPNTGYSKNRSIFEIISLQRIYQNTMGQCNEISFKDAKLLNRLYCTADYLHNPSITKCKPEEFKLNNGECKNGGYPDPLKNCTCRCPKGYGGVHCTEHKYDNCTPVYLTSHIKMVYISNFLKGAEFKALQYLAFVLLPIVDSCFIVIKSNQETNRIKAKRIVIKIEYINGFTCDYPCEDNYIEIKFLKDKTASGARVCCSNTNLPFLVSADADTEVLIMKKGLNGTFIISYQHELTPSIETNTCREIFDPKSHNYGKIKKFGAKVDMLPRHGPLFHFQCTRQLLTVNGRFHVQNWVCSVGEDKIQYCGDVGKFYCLTLIFTKLLRKWRDPMKPTGIGKTHKVNGFSSLILIVIQKTTEKDKKYYLNRLIVKKLI